jgi:hypothetical protein
VSKEAVVVAHGKDGQVVEKDRVESMFLPNTAGGGLIGLLIGIIGGPLGMLIGSASGFCLGSLSDPGDIDETESALGAISSSVQVGRTALLAVVSELNPEVIDAACRTSAAPCCDDPWPTSRPRSPRRRTRSVKPSGKPARSLPAATGSTTRLPSTRSSTS